MTREQLRAALGSVAVVDAQPPERYGQRHLPGARNLVAEDAEEYLTGALPDAAARVVVYSTDGHCRRAPQLAARLEGLGCHARIDHDPVTDFTRSNPSGAGPRSPRSRVRAR
jgi:rhodanese-related sulfurtransferase